MKFKLDENLPIELVKDLHRLGHDSDTVFQEELRGAPILLLCRLQPILAEYCLLWTKALLTSSVIQSTGMQASFCSDLINSGAAPSLLS